MMVMTIKQQQFVELTIKSIKLLIIQSFICNHVLYKKSDLLLFNMY